MQKRRNHYLYPRGPVIPFNSISRRHNRNKQQQQQLSKVKTKKGALIRVSLKMVKRRRTT
jgi:hypothetical protein